MATFGQITEPTPNVLFDPMAAMAQGQQQQRNALLMETTREDQAFQRENQRQAVFERDRGLAAQTAGAILALPDDQQDAAYEAAIRRHQAEGRLPHAPLQNPGKQHLQQLYNASLTPTQLEARADRQANRTALGMAFPAPGSAPAAAPAGGGGAAPAAGGRPFVAQNLPAGVDPQTDQMVRTVLGEAGGEDERGQQAVAHVILNRARQSGQSTEQVIYAPNQFEPWNNGQTRAKLEAINPASPEYQRVLEQVRRVQGGEAPDPTGGATHFYSPTAQTALGRPAPSWDNGKGTDLGRHRFFSLGFGAGSGTPGAAPAQQQAAAAPAPPPTPAGGVAGRTGGTDVAGPGAGSSAETDLDESGLTRRDRRALYELSLTPGADLLKLREFEEKLRTHNLTRRRDAQNAPVERVSNPDGSETLVPRSQAVGAVSAPKPDQTLVPILQPDGSTIMTPRPQAAGAVSAAPRDNTLVEVPQPDGSKRFVPRSEAAGQTSAAPPVVDTFGRANTLRDEHRTLTADFRTIQTAYQNIQTSAKSNNGAGDMSMLYSYVKMLDPGSVVRESEFATAAASGSYGERIQGAVARILTGQRLPETLRNSFVSEAKNLHTTQRRNYDQVSKQYREMAVRHGLKPEDVVTDYITPDEAPGGGGGGGPVAPPPGFTVVR